MGCDIHMFAEREEKGKWIKTEESMPNPDYKEGSENFWEKNKYTKEIYDGRNYELFAFLADVRNADDIKAVCPPRGVPEDASHGYLHELDSWDCDAHSKSYFTLSELRDIPKKLLNQIVDDTSLIMEKDKDGNIVSTCRATNRDHLGPVGKRPLFKKFKGTKNPIEQIIKQLEYLQDGESDEDLRIVFFFDN